MKPTTVHRATFKTSRLAEFCSRRELVAQTGQAVETWPIVILKELGDNATDEAEQAGTTPWIKVEVTTETGSIVVVDQGRGISPELVANLLDFTSRTSSQEAHM
jgi:DNA topoisomerase VI subunit B